MSRPPIWSWGLVAFFFFGGLALAAWEETSWIGIGQIWMAVAVLVGLIFLASSGKLGEKLGRRRKTAGDLGEAIMIGGSKDAPNDTAAQLERLERLRAGGDLTDAEYRAQRDRIVPRT